MRLVDTHTHVWGPDTADLPWYGANLPPEWSGPYSHTDLVADMDAAEVDEGVLQPTTIYGRDERANEYTLRAIEAHPERLWGVGVMEYFQDEPDLRQAVRRVTGHERMLGIRFHAAFEYGETPGQMDRQTDWIADDALDPLYDEIATQDAAVFVLAKPGQYSMLATLAAANPHVTFVLEHMGWPDEGMEPDEAPWTDIETLAEHENVYVKVSSVPRASGDDWPYETAGMFVRKLLAWFGPERLMLGSDYPWLDDCASYRECLSWPEAVEYLSARDLSWLSYRTFESLWE
ncbi:L-fuconolactonase [Halogranum gelatinilyticum]|uniref:L-fuconolactonase n=1 Tax=Halogranum gelatinilyticum TaxID=660521 RepID=A0A1G9XF68_9EURY|nr:amidohydrolase family protein [Halogranum gelatinilyticum]SDM94933.1 L-fuconolactonase [Halogranum gelatinilyticum]